MSQHLGGVRSGRAEKFQGCGRQALTEGNRTAGQAGGGDSLGPGEPRLGGDGPVDPVQAPGVSGLAGQQQVGTAPYDGRELAEHPRCCQIGES